MEKDKDRKRWRVRDKKRDGKRGSQRQKDRVMAGRAVERIVPHLEMGWPRTVGIKCKIRTFQPSL